MRLGFLAALVGFLIALQSRINGELSHQLGNPLQAALYSFSSGLLALGLVSLFIPGVRAGAIKIRVAVREGHIHKWKLFAGTLGATLVAVQSQVVPILGVAIFSVATIAGQTVASLAVDRLGLSSGGKRAVTLPRVVASVLTIAAVLISVWDRIDSNKISWLPVTISGLAGMLVGIQRALNGKINEYSRQSFTTSLLNFITGTTFLAVIFIVGLLVHRTHITAFGHGPWWIYFGGVVGGLYIAFAATVVQHLGALTSTFLTVGGQLLGSLLIDLVIPTHGVNVSLFLVTGIVMTYAGVVVGGSNQSRFARK